MHLTYIGIVPTSKEYCVKMLQINLLTTQTTQMMKTADAFGTPVLHAVTSQKIVACSHRPLNFKPQF